MLKMTEDCILQAILSTPEASLDNQTHASEPIIENDLPAVSQAQELLLIEESDDQMDIFALIKGHLRGLRKLKATPSILKRLMHYTAVIEYMKIRDRLIAEKKTKQPGTRASLIVAARMGKGITFARQVRAHTFYLQKNGRLPPFQTKKRPGGHTLLDNESLLLAVRRYFALQGIGEITPLRLQQHVNKIIIPTLFPGPPDNTPQTISVRTAQSWMRKLGYVRTQAKKGIYIDGHDRPDVIEARKEFLDRVKELEP